MRNVSETTVLRTVRKWNMIEFGTQHYKFKKFDPETRTVELESDDVTFIIDYDDMKQRVYEFSS